MSTAAEFFALINVALTDILGKENFWVLKIFICVLTSLFAGIVFKRFLKKLYVKSKSTKSLWDDALVGSLQRPGTWFIWGLGIVFAAEIAQRETGGDLLELIATVRRVGSIVVVAWFLTGFISKAEKNLASDEFNEKPMDKTTALALGKLLRISVVITALLVALQSMGYSVSGVLAFGGIGGIAVGFAAKDLLANFFGGLMIYLDRPFAVGDWVRSPDKNIEGTVEDIGWRLTRIRTFDKRPLYVPNATFTQISVENPSRMSNRRIYETIGIRYEDAEKLPAIVTEVMEMLREHPEVDAENTLIVNFNSFGSSSLDFFVYCFTHTTQWIKYHEIKQDVLLKILEVIVRNKAECAFPTSTLHLAGPIEIAPSESSS